MLVNSCRVHDQYVHVHEYSFIWNAKKDIVHDALEVNGAFINQNDIRRNYLLKFDIFKILKVDLDLVEI